MRCIVCPIETAPYKERYGVRRSWDLFKRLSRWFMFPLAPGRNETFELSSQQPSIRAVVRSHDYICRDWLLSYLKPLSFLHTVRDVSRAMMESNEEVKSLTASRLKKKSNEAESMDKAKTKRRTLIMDRTEIEDMDILMGESGLPAELNQLKTTELLPAVHNYQGLTGFLNEDQYDDPLTPVVTDNIKVENFIELAQRQSPSEVPNSTMPSGPLPTCTHPCLEDFEGEFGFTICYEALNSTSNSNSWSYSEILKQVFIKMNNVLMIQFKTNRPLSSDGFFIRALLVYQSNDYMNQPVNRCSIHWIDDDSSQLAHRSPRFCECEKYHLAGHVLRCQTEGAQYQFDSSSERHSVVVDVPRTPQPGSDFIRAVHYFFSCKTSCPKGMQRRAVQLVFTLEDARCQVYGRKVLPVKICSCPKRDKDRQEKDFTPEDVCERKGSKRPINSQDLEVQPIKILKQTSLFNLHLRNATEEGLETAFVNLVAKQKKDYEQMKNLIVNFESRHQMMEEIVKKFAAFRQPHIRNSQQF